MKKSKYLSKKTRYNGVTYDSKAEASFAQHLDLLKMALGNMQVTDVERQPAFPVSVNGKKICTYKADFRVKYGDGRVVVFDVKGMKTPVYRLKKKLVEAIYGIEIIEVINGKYKI